MVDVPAGSLYLGARIDPAQHTRLDEPLLYPAAQLTTHGVIVGMTGSGKTGLAMVLLEEALLSGVPVLVLDPKGDMGNLALTFPALDAASFEPWVPESDVQRSGRTRAEVASDVATQWRDGLAGWGIDGARIAALRERADVTIYTPGSTVGVPLDIIGNLRAPAGGGDAELVQDEIEGLVSSLLGLVGVESDPLSGREHILLSNLVSAAWAAGRDLDLATLISQVQQPPMRKLGVIDLDTFFPPKDRTELALRLNGLVASPSFAAWTQGAPLDIDSLLYTPARTPRAAVVQLSHLSDDERQFVVTIILSKVITWLRRQPGTSDLRALLYMDEVFGFVPPTAAPPSKKAILTIFKQARAFGVGMVLATQNPVDVDYKAISNAGTWIIGRLQTERDKARLVEGLRDAAGTTDVGAITDTIGGLAKREFVLRTSTSDTPTVFTSRWAMSYLPGPLSREQTSTLMQGRPAAAAQPAPGQPAPAAAAAAGPSAAAVATPAPPPPADDETEVAPRVANGVAVYHLDPAAPWASEVDATPDGRRLRAGIVARCRLLFDDEKADLREEQEWEAVFFPLTDQLRPDDARAVDYDERDLRPAAPDGARYVLPDAPIDTATYFTQAKRALQDHLFRTHTIEVQRNAELKLFARPGESPDDFAKRCAAAADEQADAEVAKLRDAIAKKSDRVREAIARAEDRVREAESDRSRRGLEAVVSVGGGLLGSLLGGRKSTKGILSTIGRATSKGGMTKASTERLESARNRLAEGKADLDELEAELASDITEIADRWDAKAAAIDTVEIPLERTDIRVDELAVVWIPTA
jgi:hypothetical protein